MILEIDSLSKTFPGQIALDRATLSIGRGEIHALVGQNGSGKSTLIKLLTGYHSPDDGAQVRFAGSPIDLNSMGSDVRDRIHVMHQDLGLVGSLNAIENLALGRGFHTTGTGRIKWSSEAKRVTQHLASLGMDLDVRRPVDSLSQAERAMLALARATQDWDDSDGLLILDEPTASLPQAEVDSMFAAIREFAGRGAGVMFVSHRLDEVFAIADAVTVLRDGSTVASGMMSDLDHETLIHHIVGRDLGDLYGHHDTAADEPSSGDVRARVTDLWGQSVRGVSFDVHRGEVLGVAGLTGSGRDEIGSLMFDGTTRVYGTLELDGASVDGGIPESMRAGVAFVPSDRKNLGSIQTSSVRENMMLPSLASFMKGIRYDASGERAEAQAWVERVDVRPPRPESLLSTLSGGNQQKAVLARWLRRSPTLFILDEPTQGVDVGAKASIYQLLLDAADSGAGVVIVSSDTEELANVCDRVIVLRDGEVAIELAGTQLTEDALVQQIWSFDEQSV